MKKESKKYLLIIVWSFFALGLLPVGFLLWNLFNCKDFGCGFGWLAAPFYLIAIPAVLLVIAVLFTVFMFNSKGIRTQEKV